LACWRWGPGKKIISARGRKRSWRTWRGRRAAGWRWPGRWRGPGRRESGRRPWRRWGRRWAPRRRRRRSCSGWPANPCGCAAPRWPRFFFWTRRNRSCGWRCAWGPPENIASRNRSRCRSQPSGTWWEGGGRSPCRGWRRVRWTCTPTGFCGRVWPRWRRCLWRIPTRDWACWSWPRGCRAGFPMRRSGC